MKPGLGAPGPQSRTATVAVVLVASMVTGGWLIDRGAKSGANTPAEAARLFDNVFVHVYRHYVDSLGASTLYRKAVDGMLYELEDPYTVLLAPEKLGRLTESTSGNYAGVGIQVDVRDGAIVVITPLTGTPAERAGIQPGDRIVEIDGRSTRGWTLEEATKAFRGRPGSTISLRVERPGIVQPIPYTLARRPIHRSAVRRTAMLPNAVGYIDLKAFSDSTERELALSVNALLKRGMKSLVLDLRSNPGGLLDQGLRVADLFLSSGQKIVSLRGRAPGTSHEYTDSTAQRWPALPLVVLVDDKSASAAEIVAGALQDHDRAVLVGDATYGKGSAQTVIPLGEVGGLKITTARWYTPSGRSISRPVDRDPEDDMDDDASSLQRGRRYRTASGRIMYDGGGIRPDLIVRDSAMTEQLSELQRALGRRVSSFRDAITVYALSLKASGAVRSPQFVVTPEMRDEVWKRLVARGVDIPRITYDAAESAVSALIAYDIARYVFGPEAEFRRRVAADRVIAAALQLATDVRSQQDLLGRADARAREQQRTTAGD